jgi:hypothetical protein
MSTDKTEEVGCFTVIIVFIIAFTILQALEIIYC